MNAKRSRTVSLPEWRKYMRFWGRDVERDIDDELRFHLEMRERDLIASGLSPAEAHDAALARFGPIDEVTAQLRQHDLGRVRYERRAELMEALAQDIRYGARKLVQSPGFAVAVIIVLALGIGVNTAIFSAVDAVLLRPLPFTNSGQLALMDHVNIPTNLRGVSEQVRVKRQPDITDVAAMKDVVQSLGAYAPGGLNLTGIGDAIRVKVALATPSLFRTLDARAMLGRTFVEEEGTSTVANVTILSYGLWQRQFGADSNVVGKSIALSGIPHTVVGVMPKSFAFPSGTELWIPLSVPFSWQGAQREAIRSYLPSMVVLRLAPGVSADVAGKRVRALFEPYATAERPIEHTAADLVMPMQQTLVKHRRTALLVLMGTAALVLLTACANVTNLLLSRAAARRREIGIRAALGASRRRIVQQLLTESLLLSMLGGLLGIAVAYAGLGVLTSLMPVQLVDVIAPAIDLRVLGFSLLLAMITGLLFGIWPAFGLAKRGAATTMAASGSYGATAGDGAKLRRLFVVSEMAFALMLLIGAGLMLRSFRELMTTDSGVKVEQVASVELTLARSRYPNAVARSVFYQGLLQRLQQTPGIEAAAAINEIPLRGEWGIGISVEAEGKVRDPDAEPVYPQYLRVTPEYFRTMGINLVAGRALQVNDDSLHPAAVINKAMADKVWPGENAVGKRFAFGTMPGEVPNYITVVGIIGDVRSHSIEMAPAPQMYLPFMDSPSDFAGIVVRGSGEPRAMLSALRDAVRATAPDQAMFNLRMLEEAVASTVAPRRTNTLLIATFGVLAVILAALGVYAVIAYGVAQRTREIGIRIALGAQVSDVLRMVVREGLMLALVGIAIGLGAAWALSRLMESLLYGVSARDPFTFIASPLVLLALAMLATLIPARAAAKVDPAKAVREEG